MRRPAPSRRRPLKLEAGPTCKAAVAGVRALAVRSSCLHLSTVRTHAPPQLRAAPTSFAPKPDLLKLAAGHQLYDVIVTPNPHIDAGSLRRDLTSLLLPPTISSPLKFSSSPHRFPPSRPFPHQFRPLHLSKSLPSNFSCLGVQPGPSKVRPRRLLSCNIRCVYAHNLVGT